MEANAAAHRRSRIGCRTDLFKMTFDRLDGN